MAGGEYVYFHDERVHGNTPRCDFTVLTNARHNLGSRVRELADGIDRRFSRVITSFRTLHILCHGGPSGLGLASGAHQWNVQLFSALRNKVGRIEVHGCTAARDYTQETPAGPYNGQQFGQWLAMCTNATVLASDVNFTFPPIPLKTCQTTIK